MDKLTDQEQLEMFESLWSDYSERPSFFMKYHKILLSIAAMILVGIAILFFNNNRLTNANGDSNAIIATSLEESFWQDQYSNEEDLMLSLNDSDIDEILLMM
ncbi:hypothetical protein JXR93_09940 [bacterium]|nr:hypothetical protein [bacterium]